MQITIAIINSRGNTNPEWVEAAIASARSQYYRNAEIVIIDNRDKLYTIGKCRNDAVKQAKGEYVFFLDDDDWISKDYLLNLAYIAKEYPKAKWISTSCFFVHEDKTEYREEAPIGMWRKDFLLEKPFPENVVRYEDVILHKEIQDTEKVQALHIAGYFYRQHNHMNSFKKAKIKEELKEDIKCLSLEIENIIKNKNVIA